MRTEQQMMQLIMDTAHRDERIRAVIMSGSRVNPAAPRDIFQDYDIVYIVTEVESFLADGAWIDRFGERMILQLPDSMGDAAQAEGSFSYLMQFMDGNRIDLTLYPVALLSKHEVESLSVLLLDKDGLFAPFPVPDERDYLPQPPTEKAFADCCNEFWWVALYVAKGLWRRELPYAKHMMDSIVRIELIRMLTWYVRVTSEYACGTGKYGKYLQKCLTPELWAKFEQTYADADFSRSWDALSASTELFRQVAQSVADSHGFDYPHMDDERVSAHLRYVRALPPDAVDMA